MKYPIQRSDDSIEFLEKAEYIKDRAFYYTSKLKVEVTDQHIRAILAMVERGEELAPESPNEFFTIYEEISAALAEHKQAAKQKEAERLANKQAQEQNRLARSTKEAQLIESVKDISMGSAWGSFTEKFDLGKNLNQCLPKGDVTDEELVGALALGFGMENMSQWVIGDVVTSLERLGYENVVVQVCDLYKKAYPTVSGYARVSKAVPANKRDSSIPFSTYKEIANARLHDNPEKNNKAIAGLIEKAVEEKWGVAEARAAVDNKRDRAKGAKNGDEPAKKGNDLPQFFVAQLNAPINSYFCKEPPNYSSGTLITNLRTREFLDLSNGKESWVKFPSEET
jgi:hypothetical protein